MWKDTNVIPLYKRGDKSDAKNYRPVSLTSMVSKVTERIVRQLLYDHLSTIIALSPMPSMASALEGPVSLNCWTLSMCGTSQWRTGSLLMCCSWTCLRPSIESLTCAKLRMMGIDGDILSWLRDYLSSRRQRCILEGCASGWLPV